MIEWIQQASFLEIMGAVYIIRILLVSLFGGIDLFDKEHWK